MSRSKIQDETEVRRWFDEGKSYTWMIEEYRRKYNIETTYQMWTNYRARRGIERRWERDDELIPWTVKNEHRSNRWLMFLRLESRKRRGVELSEAEEKRREGYMEELSQRGMVVAYHRDSERGFFLVPREPGDADIIRRPPRPGGRRAG